MKKGNVILRLRNGMHMRPAGVLAAVAGRYSCSIEIETNGTIINAKSVMMLVSAGIRSGSQLTVICDGENETDALAAVCGAIESGLGEAC